jgi:hypothetical protein
MIGTPEGGKKEAHRLNFDASSSVRGPLMQSIRRLIQTISSNL